jgi:hypothetical protein
MHLLQKGHRKRNLWNKGRHDDEVGCVFAKQQDYAGTIYGVGWTAERLKGVIFIKEGLSWRFY